MSPSEPDGPLIQPWFKIFVGHDGETVGDQIVTVENLRRHRDEWQPDRLDQERRNKAGREAFLAQDDRRFGYVAVYAPRSRVRAFPPGLCSYNRRHGSARDAGWRGGHAPHGCAPTACAGSGWAAVCRD
jgi:hypothetical protein